MANGIKTGGRDFQPGQSGNPAGRPTVPEELKAARRLNKTTLERILNEYIHLPMVELAEKVKDPSTPAIELMVAKVLHEAIKRGDEKRLGFILDRLVGAVKKTVAVEGGDEESNPIRLANMTNAERAQLIKIARGEVETNE